MQQTNSKPDSNDIGAYHKRSEREGREDDSTDGGIQLRE